MGSGQDRIGADGGAGTQAGRSLRYCQLAPLPREQTTVLDKPRGPKTEMRMSPDDVRAVVEPAGFRLADLVELSPYHYGVVFRKSPA
jgi:hypothetical protein